MLLLVLTFLTLWYEGFDEGINNFSLTNPNLCEINYIEKDVTGRSGIIHIKGNPEKKGLASAWLYVDKVQNISKRSRLSLFLKGNGRKIRIRLYWKQRLNHYLEVKKTVITSGSWEEIVLFLSNSKPIWSSNFPTALTPEKKPDLFLFIENAEPGPFDILIDEINIRGDFK